MSRFSSTNNTFKIKNPEDLATIQGLKNVTILYDPERSNADDENDVEDSEDIAEEKSKVEIDSEALLDDEEAASSSGFQSPITDLPGHIFTIGHFLQPINNAPGHRVIVPR